MKYSHRLSDAVHILAFLDIYKDGDLSSNSIARSIESNPSLIRRLMAMLSKAGLIRTHAGVVAPTLAKPAAQITLLDVYQVIDDERHLLHIDPKTNPQCIVGGNIQAVLDADYAEVQQAAEAKMQTITLQSIIDAILVRQAAKQGK
ncbi:hypothetical protein IV38_GL000950 [Lactobacillus selangorensis]|uniref:Transcriptional regulator n=1 Tax=Lactobacillus selangorensis TaxID=81857 RepID=A0A0R2G8A4_9LACO|nr:Rrf2 family transcriptional regulator [Lactobacillus selangorensis]KRN28745.1 hypothetical protein IV38_GL000950 [Lactobacillus selangorensis]KRN32845.1 hypothetical protein IV40_GL000903 [Lactobacillus selangorensis]